ncbi:MAG: hypothetical protein LBI53_03780 [Candidatus Peribacteria bacterium]|jgi:uncharacterized protein (UPF0371 family)|nr:hypothetical protein [Candidatus Peribacteria bacterium]
MQFDYPSYLSNFSQQMQQKLSQVSKLYVELSGNIIDQTDTYKKIFAPYKYDMEILFCVKAQDIIDDLPTEEEGKSFRDFIRTSLKKIENQLGVRPHIVINLIDIENMYDMVFAFETHFQKL